MNIKDRKPRKRRFDTDPKAVRIARLKDDAPGLGGSRRLTTIALFGAVLMVLAVAGFYFAMEIVKASGRLSEDTPFINVDSAPQIGLSNREELLQRLEQADSQAEVDYQAIVAALQEFAFRDDLTRPDTQRKQELEAQQPVAPELQKLETADSEKMPEVPISGW